MRGWKASLALLVVVSFCIPPAAQAHNAESGPTATAGRGEYAQAGVVNVSLNLVASVYQNSSFTISLPGNATIGSASVDLEGNPVMSSIQSLTADFANDPGSQYLAYAGSYSKNTPGTAKPSTFQGNQLQSYDLSNIAYSDNRYATNYVYYTEYGYHRFQFKVPFDVVSKVNVVYEGYAGYTYYGIGTVACYVWNNITGGGTWENVGTGSDSPKSSFNKDFNGAGYSWGQGNNHYVDVLAICEIGSYPSYPYNFISTDYVKIYVEGNVLTYPKNPKLYIGNAYSPAWSLQTDKFDSLVSIGDVVLMNQIQDVTRRATGQNANVIVNLKSETPGKIRISNFKVSYTAPPWCKGIPDTFTLDEDTPNPKLINLNDYFTDDVDTGHLKFEIIYEENPKLLDGDITSDGGWMGFKLPTKNWHGALRFQVRATDGDSLQRDSNKFLVTVAAVNDPPVISPIGRQLATEDSPFALTVRVKDVDMDLDPDETVIFSDNTSHRKDSLHPDTGAGRHLQHRYHRHGPGRGHRPGEFHP
jgi:hypothetical protein